jgi:hypothetical protein
MKITKQQLRWIIHEEILREAKEDQDFDPANADLPIPKKLQKLLDPDLSPQKFATLDAELDDTGSEAHQAFAVAAFALTYADNDEASAKNILQKAMTSLPAIIKSMEVPKEKEK